MKKFLSLVLALVMTMSLVTISAGATEYKDLTDKDEIQYEEAVAVLNRIGIITGYEDGSFRPETELTRGAAAKIIVSLMIGPEAASNLSNNTSPYPDVPAGHTFAGVISYCKTAGYISGYGDGTFKPANSLTGFAFAKMLLGAVGYKSELEGFTGTGWTMNVARLGNIAGLFNRLSFQGADAVNREEACQLALNTLKATMVEYTGGFTITTGDAAIVGDKTRTYVTSNQAYATNIDNRKADSEGNSKDNHYTVEFGEEHFKDLRLDDDHEDAKDDFGRPSNVWSYKKVTIGTFPVAPDFTFDKQMAYSDKTDAVKNRATGLGGYTLKADSGSYTHFWVNGTEYTLDGNGKWQAACPVTNDETAIKAGLDAKIANISDLTDNGTVVEVYVSEDEADFITDVVVVKSQLMEVKKIGSDYVSLEKNDPDDGDKNFPGFNQNPIDVKVGNVQAEDAAYAALKDLKAGDNVVVIPVDADHDGKDFEVAEAYEPETVSGALTGVKDYGPTNKTKNAVSLTVGGTEYSISLWNKDMSEIDGDKIKVTKKDVTLTLDKHGYALLAEDVGSTNDWMVVGSFRSNVENGRIVTVVTGWDISGEPVELNLGPNYNQNTTGVRPGDLVKYESTSVSNLYDWKISESGVYNVFTGVDTNTGDPYKIKASNVKVDLRDYADDEALFIDKGVKFIYVTFDVDDEVESIEVKSEVKNVENKELRTTAKGVIPNETDGGVAIEDDKIAYQIENFNAAQAAVTDKGAIKAVVIKQESNEADSASMLYVRDMPGGAHYDATGKMVYVYTVVMNTADGVREDETIYSYDRLYRGDFASYAKTEHAEYDEFYTLRQRNNFTQRTTSTFQADIMDVVNVNASLVELDRYSRVDSGDAHTALLPDYQEPNVKDGSLKANLGVGDEADVVSLRTAAFVDLTGNDIDSFDDLKTYMYTKVSDNKEYKWRQNTVEAQLVVNDNPDTDGFRRVSLVIITDVDVSEDSSTKNQKNLTAAIIGDQKSADGDITIPGANGFTTVTLTEKVAKDAVIRFAYEGKDMEIELNGTKISNGSSHELHASDAIVVTVTDLDDQSVTYTFNIAALTPAAYQNSTALAHATATGYATADWDNTAASNVTLTGLDFDFPFFQTGVRDDTKAQLEEAIAYYNDSNSLDNPLGAPTYVNNGIWGIPMGALTVTFDESAAANTKVLIKIDNGTAVAESIVAATSTITAGTSLTQIVKETEADGITVNYYKTADLNNVVKPGATYKGACAAELTLSTVSGTGAALFDVTYKNAANKTLITGDFLEEDDVITVTLTAKNDIDLSPATTALSVTAASAVDAALACSDDTNVDSATTSAITFTKGTAGAKLLQGETITFTVTVAGTHIATGTAAIAVPNLTIVAPAA